MGHANKENYSDTRLIVGRFIANNRSFFVSIVNDRLIVAEKYDSLAALYVCMIQLYVYLVNCYLLLLYNLLITRKRQQ
jgi:hypothetical protein